MTQPDSEKHAPAVVGYDNECPNGPDEDGNWPCDLKGYFGVAECQVCGRIGQVAKIDWTDPDWVIREHNRALDAALAAGREEPE